MPKVTAYPILFKLITTTCPNSPSKEPYP